LRIKESRKKEVASKRVEGSRRLGMYDITWIVRLCGMSYKDCCCVTVAVTVKEAIDSGSE